MRTGLVVLGIIFLVIGGLLYFVPMQQFGAQTTNIGDGSSDTRTSYASVSIPPQWAYVFGILGLLVLVVGLVIPGPDVVASVETDTDHYGSYEKVRTEKDVEIDDADVEIGGGGKKRRVIHERHERRVHRS